MSDTDEDMPYINFDEKPVWYDEQFKNITGTAVRRGVQDHHQEFNASLKKITSMQSQSGTRERFTFMTPIGSGDDNRAGVQVHLPYPCAVSTQLVQVNDTNLHAEIGRLMDMQGTDVGFKNITGTDEEPKAKAPKVNHDKTGQGERPAHPRGES